jgi:predicted Zn-dependent protease
VPLAPVAILRPPADRAPLRLTGRGVVVLGVAAAMLAIALVALARLSAPSAAPAPVAPRVVTVQPGDTLWAIATRIAPDVDPRLEVDQLRRLNSLDPGGLMPGQQLRTR